MKKLLLAIAALAAIGLAIFQWQGGTEGLVKAAIPTFPELPPPQSQLQADSQGDLYFESSTPFDLDVLLNDPDAGIPTTATGRLFLPEGASADRPVPAMVVVHGSGGISPGREMEYGQLLTENGYAALVLDYYLPRGSTKDTPYMLRVISITEFDALTDAYAGLRILSTHPAIDPDRIGVMGFSYGGMASRFAMDDRFRKKLAPDHPGFAAFVDYYGPCFQTLGTTRTNGAPLLTLRGTEDASNDLEACAEREDELRVLGVTVEAHLFEGAGHAWENTAPRALLEDAPYLAGCEVRYDDQGYPRVDGQYVLNVPTETSRERRIALRMTSGDHYEDCVGSGYVVGNDPDTKAKSDQRLLAFLKRYL